MTARAAASGLPVGPMLAAAAVAAIVLLGVSLPAGHGPMLPVRIAPAPLQAARALRFVERADGTLEAFDAADGAVLAVLPPERNGFLHALVHGLAATRRRAGVPADRAYPLSLFADGRLVLVDPSTATSIDMEGFGPTNMAGVLALLAPEPPRP